MEQLLRNPRQARLPEKLIRRRSHEEGVMKTFIPILFLAIVLSPLGCTRAHPRFGLEQNDIRRTKGLPLVMPEWKVYHSLRSETQWKSEYAFDGTPGHAGKKVFYLNGAITGEEDYYYSGKTFVPSYDPEAGTMSEMLTIHYDYANTNAPWTCIHSTTNDLKHLSLGEAAMLLESWGLHRLTY